MTVINCPTKEQIAEALAIVNKSKDSCCVTADRYAMTQYGTFVNNGNISIPKAHIKAIQYISTYGDTCGNVRYVLEGIFMYSKKDILEANLIPVHPDEIPQHYDNIQVVIIKN